MSSGSTIGMLYCSTQVTIAEAIAALRGSARSTRLSPLSPVTVDEIIEYQNWGCCAASNCDEEFDYDDDHCEHCPYYDYDPIGVELNVLMAAEEVVADYTSRDDTFQDS